MGKKYVESAKLIDKSALYNPNEALELTLKTAKANFDETIELHVRLGVDPRHADQQVRGAVVYQTELVEQLEFLYLLRELKLMKLQLQEQIS